MRWYLARDPRLVPHLFRLLLPLWALQDDLEEASSWVEQLLPAADSLDPPAQAELLLAATMTAREMGDDESALKSRQRLATLLGMIQDPYLHAVAVLATAWISAITGDFDGALRQARMSLAGLRDQDELYRRPGAVFAGGGRCWVRTNVG
jgi:hypothetical protein